MWEKALRIRSFVPSLSSLFYRQHGNSPFSSESKRKANGRWLASSERKKLFRSFVRSYVFALSKIVEKFRLFSPTNHLTGGWEGKEGRMEIV